MYLRQVLFPMGITRRFIMMLIIMVIVSSCRKNHNDKPDTPTETDKKIKLIDYTTGNTLNTHYRVVYYPDGNVDSIVTNKITDSNYRTDYSKFIYNDSGYVIIKNQYYPSHPWEDITDTVFIKTNSTGKIARIYSLYSNDTLILDYNDFMINTLKYGTSTSSPYLIYSWNSSSGDMESYASNNNPGFKLKSYTYDISQLNRTGDMIWLGQFLDYGRAYIMPKHLVNKLSADNATSDYKYDFDNWGRITKVRIITTNTGTPFGTIIDTTSYVYSY